MPDASGFLLVSPNANLEPNRILVSNSNGLVETLNMNVGKLVLGTTGGSYEQLTPTGLGGIVITNAGGELRFDLPTGTSNALLRYNNATGKWMASAGATLDGAGNFGTTANLTVDGNTTLGNNAASDQVTINGKTVVDVTGQSMTVAGLPSTGTFTDDVLLIAPSPDNSVKRRSMADLIGAEGGITYNEASNGRMRLGSSTNVANPLLGDRFLNLNNNDLTFTTNGGSTALATFEAGAGGTNYGVALNSAGSGFVSISGPVRINTTGSAVTSIGSGAGNVNVSANILTMTAGSGPTNLQFVMNSNTASIQSTGSEQTITLDDGANEILLESNDFSLTAYTSISIKPTQIDVIGNTLINGTLNVKKSTTIGDGNGDNLSIDVSNAGVNGSMTIKGLNNGSLADDVLMIGSSPANIVKRRSLADLIQADNGITYNESSLGYIRLGSPNATSNALTTNRYINVGPQNLYFTANSGTAFPLTIEGAPNATNYGVSLVAGTSASAAISMLGNVTVDTRNSGTFEVTSGDNIGTRLNMSSAGALLSYEDNVSNAQINFALDPGETMLSLNATDGGLNDALLEVKAIGLFARGTTNINIAGNKSTTIGSATAGAFSARSSNTVTLTAGTTLTATGATGATMNATAGALTLNANSATGSVVVNATNAAGDVDINAGDAITVDGKTIGLTTAGGDVTISVPGATSGNDLVLNGIDPTTAAVNMLTLDGSNNVRRKALTSMADEGLQYDATDGEFKLGNSTDGNTPITSSRFVRVDGGGTLTFNTGTQKMLELNNNGAVNINTTGNGATSIGSAAAGAIGVQSQTTIGLTAGTTLTATGATGATMNATAGALTLNANSATGEVEINATNGAGVIDINAGDAVTVDGKSIALTSTSGNTSINTTGTSSTNIGNTAGSVTITGTTTMKSASELRFEDNDGTANYSSFKAGSQTANIQYTLPTSVPTATNNILKATTTSNPITLAWSNPNSAVVYDVNSPATWTGNQDNVALPTDATVMRVSSTVDVNLNGLSPTGVTMGRIMVLVNSGTKAITLKDNNSGTANAGFILPGDADVVLAADGSITLMYDATSGGWRVLSVN
ncbi:MAG: hypothetical protein FGM33_04265 [Candidatus Kapabacteria bacterium]|nr:hypothetical protein [Candidatus Kapabacteria bacterium]